MKVSKKTLGRAIRLGVRSGELVAKCALCMQTLASDDIRGGACPGCSIPIRTWSMVRYWHAEPAVVP